MTKPEPPAMKIVKTHDAPWTDALRRGNYDQQRKELGGLGMLRASLWQLAPGKKSFPLHRHHATEEALFILSGRGKVRTESGETVIGAGDYVAFPPGGPAHQLVNDGAEPLVYVGMSATPGPVDVVEYPDSRKLATAMGGLPYGRRIILDASKEADYFDGDPDA